MNTVIANKYEFAYIQHKFKKIYVGINNREYPEDDKIIEARFFDEKGEYRVLPEYGIDIEIVFDDIQKYDDFSDVIEREYSIENADYGKSITVKCFIQSDDDGQAVIKRKCLCGWKGKNNG